VGVGLGCLALGAAEDGDAGVAAVAVGSADGLGSIEGDAAGEATLHAPKAMAPARRSAVGADRSPVDDR